MGQTAIRDELGRIVAYQEKRHGALYLLSPIKRELGYYDERRNETWQIYPSRKLISRAGNLLATLIGPDTVK